MPWEDAEPEILELAEFAQEFNRESDRGAALIAASLLDERLKGILQAFFLDSKVSYELLNGANAPLGTFSSRISASYALGLIQKNELDEINLIRKIRNTPVCTCIGTVNKPNLLHARLLGRLTPEDRLGL